MDLRINEIDSKVQPFDNQQQLKRLVWEQIRAWKEIEEREKRATAERDWNSGISADRDRG
jgi:hypothetical protein